MIGRKHLAPLFMLAAGAGGPAGIAGRRPEPPPRGAPLLKAIMLERHAAARAAVGLPPLRWSDALAASAQAHVDRMAHTGRYGHAAQPMDRTRQGENLWMGARGAHRYDEMVGTWTAERRAFVNLPAPGFSRTGRWQDAGHYAQIVWRGTTAIGCAAASDEDIDYLVCRYAPPGNVVGQKAF